MSLHSIILILSQPAFALTPYSCELSREATNTNLILFGFTRSVLELTIYRTRGEHANHYTTDAVKKELLQKAVLVKEIFEDTIKGVIRSHKSNIQ